MKLFDEKIDFNQLQSEAIKEDTIREEIIAPILKALGYSAFSDNKIIRSKKFGTSICTIWNNIKKGLHNSRLYIASAEQECIYYRC
jgi:hypothetical protein